MEQPYVITAGIRAVEHAIELFSESIQDTGYVDSKLEDNARVLMDLLEFHQGYNAFHHLCSDKGQLVMDTADGDVVVVDDAMPVYYDYSPRYDNTVTDAQGEADDHTDMFIKAIMDKAKDVAEMAETSKFASDVVALDQEEIERLWPSDRR